VTRDVILSKLSSLKRCLQRIEAKIPTQAEALHQDLDAQDIVSLNLQRAVQQCVDIAAHVIAELDLQAPLSMAEGFERLKQAGILTPHTSHRMQKAVAFRNIAVHDYCSINWDIVHSISTDHLKDFKDFAKEVMLWMDNAGPGFDSAKSCNL
jgi:uncharacterized protein YutE (UPF0331/DUF86 family)